MDKVKVSIVKCEDYELKKVYRAIDEALNLIGGIEKLRSYGNRVLLKPNILTGASPEKAVTTHPVFFEAVVRIFKNYGFEVFCGESPALEDSRSAAKKCGILEVVEKYGIKFLDFKESIKVSVTEGEVVKNFFVAKEIADMDIIVSLPKLKTHAMVYYTGAMKNLFGCIVGLKKAQFHLRFPDKDRFGEMIVDLNLALKPRLAIMDGIVGMEGMGPQNGKPRKLGVVAASSDLLALDVVCASIIGYDPLKLPVLRNGLRRKNFSVSSFDEIEIVGEKFDNVRVEDFDRLKVTSDIHFLKKFLPQSFIRLVNNLVVPSPIFNYRKCVECGKCIEICPAGALRFKDYRSKKRVKISLDKCIRCYCCEEICPADAINLGIRLF